MGSEDCTCEAEFYACILTDSLCMPFIVHYYTHYHLSSLTLIIINILINILIVPSCMLQAFLFHCRLPALWVYRCDFILEHSLPVQWAANRLSSFPPSLVPVDTVIVTRLDMGHTNSF